jgi:hypothetical protein
MYFTFLVRQFGMLCSIQMCVQTQVYTRHTQRTRALSHPPHTHILLEDDQTEEDLFDAQERIALF